MLSQEYTIHGQRIYDLNQAYAKTVALKGATSKEALTLRGAILAEAKAQIDLRNEIAATQQQIADYQKEIKEYAKNYSDLYKKYYADLTKAEADYNNKLEKTLDDRQKKIDAAWADYDNALAQRAGQIANFAGLFEDIKTEDPIENYGKKLLENLLGQVTNLKGWQSALQEVSSRAIDEGLIAELQQLGPKALPELEALLGLTNDELSKYVELWKQKNAIAKQLAGQELTGLYEETKSKVQLIIDETNTQLAVLKDEWKTAAEEIRITFNSELDKMLEDIRSKGQAFKDAVMSLTKSSSNGSSSQTWYIPGIGNVDYTSKPTNLPSGSVQVMGAGGIVTRPTAAIIGESGPEAVIPLNKGYGGLVINGDIIIPAKDIAEMKNVSDFFSKIQQVARQG